MMISLYNNDNNNDNNYDINKLVMMDQFARHTDVFHH